MRDKGQRVEESAERNRVRITTHETKTLKIIVTVGMANMGIRVLMKGRAPT
jgi:hypothetical protein